MGFMEFIEDYKLVHKSPLSIYKAEMLADKNNELQRTSSLAGKKKSSHGDLSLHIDNLFSGEIYKYFKNEIMKLISEDKYFDDIRIKGHFESDKNFSFNLIRVLAKFDKTCPSQNADGRAFFIFTESNRYDRSLPEILKKESIIKYNPSVKLGKDTIYEAETLVVIKSDIHDYKNKSIQQ